MKDGNQSRYASDEDILTLYNRRDEQAIAATQSSTVPTAVLLPTASCVSGRMPRNASTTPTCTHGTPYRPPDRRACGHSSAQSCAIWQSTG